MKTTTTITVFIILVLVMLASGGAYYYLHSIAPTQAPGETTPTGQPVATSYTPPNAVTVHHSMHGNFNVYSGTLPVSLACGVVSGGVSYVGLNPILVTLAITVIKSDGQDCSNTASTKQTFSAAFAPSTPAPAKLQTLTVNGQPVSFTVVEDK